MGPKSLIESIINPGEGLLRWAWKQGERGVPLSRASKPSLDRGHATHDLLPMLVEGEVPNVRDLPVDQRSAADAIVQWFRDTRPAVMHIEEKVRSERFDLNGRIDYVRWCDGWKIQYDFERNDFVTEPCDCRDYEVGDDGEPGWQPTGVVIGDFKITRRAKEKHHFQVGGAYPLMWAEEGREPPYCHSELVLIDGDRGGYRVLPTLATPEDFEKAVAWWRAVERVKALM